jgi:hypothetical protein
MVGGILLFLKKKKQKDFDRYRGVVGRRAIASHPPITIKSSLVLSFKKEQTVPRLHLEAPV